MDTGHQNEGFWQGFRDGLRSAPVGFFAPLRLRLWRFVAKNGLASFFEGERLLVEGRLDPEGRVRPIA